MGEALVLEENNQVKRILEKITRERAESPEDRKIEFDLEINLWTNVLKKGSEGRRLGLGDHGWGDMFAQLCIKYDSDDAINLAKKIKRLYRDSAYDESVELAKQVGPFHVWDWEIEKDCVFFNTFPKELIDKMKVNGRRHISMLTNAPTGTLSILGQCSSGIEPVFRNLYTRRRKINANDKNSRADYTDQNGDKWMEFPVCERNVKEYLRTVSQVDLLNKIKDEDDLSKILPKYFITSDKIDWKKRIEFQAALTQFTDHSLSSTLNIPENTSVDTVKDLYMYAWEKGLKGVTIYRDGSRSGVLVSNKKQELEKIVRSDAPKRPNKLTCEVHLTKVKGIDYVVICGLLHGSVYEVFFGKYANQIPDKHFSGYIERKAKGKYYLCFLDESLLEFREIDINEYFDNSEYEAATRLISMSLRHGAPLSYVVSQLKKSSPNITEFGSAVSRILKKYIKLEDLHELHDCCSECGSKDINIRHEDGCCSIICNNCNFVDSKCG